MCTPTPISLLHTHLFTSSQDRQGVWIYHLELLKLLDCQFTFTSNSPCPFYLKWEKNHDIFPTMLTLMMDKQPFIEFVHSSRNLEEPDRFSDFKWSWLKKNSSPTKTENTPSVLFLFYFVFEGEFLHTTEILYHHIIYLWKKLLSENATTERLSYSRVKEHP